MQISRELSQIMKGYAILSIALHNFIHIHGFALENEKMFLPERADLFFERLGDPSWTLIGDLLSFLGWIGVPVFIFLSGYGLSKKYSNTTCFNTIREGWEYIRYSWLKLFLLMLPGVVFYILFYCFTGNYYRCLVSGLSLSLLSNIIPEILPYNPGVYWYFGLSFQLYLLFFALKKIDNKKVTAASGFLLLLCSAFFSPSLFTEQKILYWLKHNFVGWAPIFAMGMLCAEGSANSAMPSKTWLAPLSELICFALCVILNKNFYIWLLVPFAAVFFFYYLSISASRWRLAKKFGLWLGKYSSCIFVVHPIIRTISALEPLHLNFSTGIVFYCSLVPICALAYYIVYRHLLTRFLKSNPS